MKRRRKSNRPRWWEYLLFPIALALVWFMLIYGRGYGK